MIHYVAPGIIFPVLEPPYYIIYRNPTCKELSNNIAAREHPRAGSKQMATYQAVAQTQSSWSSSCERTSPRCGRNQMATYQAVAQTQSRCLTAARERPRAGSKQMATYQAVVAQTQSSSSSSNLCCSVAAQTWSVHVACSFLHTIHYASSMNAVWRTPIQRKPNCAAATVVHIFSHTQQQHACCTSLSPSISPTSVFFPLKTNWRN